MSGKAVTWAAKQTAGGPTAKCVLLIIADAYNERWGRAWPSRDTIAARAELSVKSVTRALDRLEADGLLDRELWVLESGVKLGNRYYLPAYRPDVERAAKGNRPVMVAKHFDHHGRMKIERASDGEVLYEGPGG